VSVRPREYFFFFKNRYPICGTFPLFITIPLDYASESPPGRRSQLPTSCVLFSLKLWNQTSSKVCHGRQRAREGKNQDASLFRGLNLWFTRLDSQVIILLSIALTSSRLHIQWNLRKLFLFFRHRIYGAPHLQPQFWSLRADRQPHWTALLLPRFSLPYVSCVSDGTSPHLPNRARALVKTSPRFPEFFFPPSG